MASPPVGVHSYPYGTEMTCLVTNTPFGNTETQFVCVGWSGLGSVPASGFTNTCPAFGLTNDSVIAWAWQKEYWLGAEPDGQGSLDTDSLWLPAGSHIEIEAIPDTYYHLDHWAGDTTGCTIDGTSIEVPLDGSRTIVGGFAANLAHSGHRNGGLPATASRMPLQLPRRMMWTKTAWSHGRSTSRILFRRTNCPSCRF